MSTLPKTKGAAEPTQRELPGGLSPEQLLWETETRFQIMANAAPVLLWMSRTDAMCTFFNQTWLDFTGRSLEQEWGVGWAEGVHFEDLQACLDAYLDAFNARVSFAIEYRLQRADGEYRWILDHGTPRYTPNGTFAGYIGSCVDITDRRQMEAELRGALVAKDEFLGMVSHEFRTPVTALQLQLELFRRSGLANLNEHQLDVFERMVASGTRLVEMIDSVLQFSRMERGRLRLHPRAVEVAAVARLVFEESRPAAKRKGLELHLQADENLPPIRSDAELLRMIVSNLVVNAIKFTERGAIEVSVTRQGEEQCIRVTDTGRGLKADEHGRIFEPFEQLEPSHQKHTPGVGLGLALVRRMTSMLGGRIAVQSELGAGSEFCIMLPAAAPRAPGQNGSHDEADPAGRR
jgi:PAS domain S-box-containing protein